jgi:hypothetical protein
MSLSNLEKQDLRHAVLYAFARRPNSPLTVHQVGASVRRLLPFVPDTDSVLAAIRFHLDLNHIRKLIDEWGSEETWQITATGETAYERDQNKTA